jgi:L-lactate dehydrogenase complex protein LldF
LHLRAETEKPVAERAAMRALARIFGSRKLYERAQRVARFGERPARHLPGPLARWTEVRDLRPLPPETFREWWSRERGA